MPEEIQNQKAILEWEDIDRKDGFFITHYIPDGATASNYDVIFTALKPCEILMIAETHRIAGSSTPTLQLEKLTSGQALDAGATILQSAFNLASTANTPVIKQGKDLIFTSARQFSVGDRLALKDIGTLTAIAGLQITIYFKRLGKGNYA